MGWLIASILLVIWLRTRRRLKTLTKSIDLSLSPGASPNPAVSDAQPATDQPTTSSHRQVYELSVLRLEVDRARRAEKITAALYADLTEHIDAVLSTIVHRSWAAPRELRLGKESRYRLGRTATASIYLTDSATLARGAGNGRRCHAGISPPSAPLRRHFSTRCHSTVAGYG